MKFMSWGLKLLSFKQDVGKEKSQYMYHKSAINYLWTCNKIILE